MRDNFFDFSDARAFGSSARLSGSPLGCVNRTRAACEDTRVETRGASRSRRFDTWVYGLHPLSPHDTLALGSWRQPPLEREEKRSPAAVLDTGCVPLSGQRCSIEPSAFLSHKPQREGYSRSHVPNRRERGARDRPTSTRDRVVTTRSTPFSVALRAAIRLTNLSRRLARLRNLSRRLFARLSALDDSFCSHALWYSPSTPRSSTSKSSASSGPTTSPFPRDP